MLALPLALAAQPMLEGGLFVGFANYQGDLTGSTAPNMSENNLAIGLNLRHYLDFNTSVRANFLYGSISGSDANYDFRRERGYSFETTLIEVSVVGEWEPLGQNRFGSNLSFQKRLSPYVFGGLGLTMIQPETDFGEGADNAGVIQDKEAAFSNVQIAVPFGLGLKVALDEQWVAGLELGMRAPFTDYLDGVSFAGNPGGNDWYVIGGASFCYRIK